MDPARRCNCSSSDLVSLGVFTIDCWLSVCVCVCASVDRGSLRQSKHTEKEERERKKLEEKQKKKEAKQLQELEEQLEKQKKKAAKQLKEQQEQQQKKRMKELKRQVCTFLGPASSLLDKKQFPKGCNYSSRRAVLHKQNWTNLCFERIFILMLM